MLIENVEKWKSLKKRQNNVIKLLPRLSYYISFKYFSYECIYMYWQYWQSYAVCCCWFSVAKSCLTFLTPWAVARQAPLPTGFFKQEYWCGLSFPSPEDLPTQRLKLHALHCRPILYHWATREAYAMCSLFKYFFFNFSQQICSHG